MACNLLAMASNLIAMASNLLAMASNLTAMGSNLCLSANLENLSNRGSSHHLIDSNNGENGDVHRLSRQ